MLRFHLHCLRICNIEQTILERHLHRFQLTVHRFHVQLLLKLEFFQDIQRHQRNDPLSIRRDFTDFIAAVIQPDRGNPFLFKRFQIRFAEIPAVFAAAGIDLIGDLTLVKAVGLCSADFF